MAQAARSSSQEYWYPANRQTPYRVPTPAEACSHCGSEYSPGAYYCHICGSDRNPSPAPPDPMSFADWFDVGVLRRQLGFSVASLLLFIVGIGCMIAVLLTGVIYKADSLVEWQAIQIWRIEWLLGATAAFTAGILLKKKSM